MNVTRMHHRAIICLFSAILLGLAFPPLPFGLLAAVAFVPMFILLEQLDTYGDVVRYGYLWAFVLHIIVLYWPGGFVHGRDMYLMMAGAGLVIIHPLFFVPIFMVMHAVRRHLGATTAVLTFPVLWVGMEYLRSIGELAFPWLTIGNTQTYSLARIQFIEYTGVLGLSLWLLLINSLTFILLRAAGNGAQPMISRSRLGLLGSILLLVIGPSVLGEYTLRHEDDPESGRRIDIALIQANIDPFEKWQSHAAEQLALHEELTFSLNERSLDLILWPETAVPYFALAPEQKNSFARLKALVDSMKVSLLTGMPDITIYPDPSTAPGSSKVMRDGRRYDTYNSSVLIEPSTDSLQRYAKIILVPFAERVPFSEELSFLNVMEWNFGLGGWGIGKDTTVFTMHTRDNGLARFSNVVCYESIYPAYMAAFVRRGAEFLTIITNDSWWGRTSGAYQHKQFAVLRAVETRRWIARCANGGISCFIDPYGRTTETSDLYVRTVLTGRIEPRTGLTFFARHGDWLGLGCSLIGAGMILLVFVRKVYVAS